MAKYTLEDCKRVAKEHEGDCLNTEYINCITKMRWRCKEGHEWEANLNNVKNRNTWCPECFRDNVKNIHK